MNGGWIYDTSKSYIPLVQLISWDSIICLTSSPLPISSEVIIPILSDMATLAEQIQQADIQEAEWALAKRIRTMSPEEKKILIWYLKATGESYLAKKLFGIEDLDIRESEVHIYAPDESQRLYRWAEHGERWWQMQKLSEPEIHLLVKAFFHSASERQYVVKTFFYEDGFMRKTSGDIMDYLSKAEQLFQQTSKTREKTLSLVQKNKREEISSLEAANDAHFTPLVDRIWDEEPWYFDYIHETYRARLEFVESLFIETIRHLAEEPRNHIWALDPERHTLYAPPRLQSKIDLIRSICEFHKMIDPGFPLLHTLVASTLGAWILLYKWFSAPTYNVRKILWSK